MTRFNNTAEGQTSGTAATASNSGGGSGTAFGQVVIGTGCSIIYSNGQAAHGTNSYLFTAASGQNCYAYYATGTTACETLRFYRYYTGAPSAEITIAKIYVGSTVVMALCINASGTLRVRDATNASPISGSNAIGAAQTAGTWYRYEVQLIVGTTSSNGYVLVNAYVGDGTTPVATFTSLIWNSGTTDFDHVYYGRSTGAAVSDATYYDDLAADDGLAQGTLIGPVGANIPPSITMGADQTVQITHLATVTATGHDTDGTIASYAWSVLSKPTGSGSQTLSGATTATCTFTPTNTGLYVMQCVITDNGGATATGVLNVFVPSGTITVIGVQNNLDSWVNTGGAVDIPTALSDSSDTTYVAAPPSPVSATVLDLFLAPLLVSNGLSLDLRDLISGTGSLTTKARIVDQGTIRKEWSNAPGSSFADETLTMNSTECAAITNWNQLVLELSVIAS